MKKQGNKGKCTELARAYIVIQRFKERFSPKEGLRKGTVFPELYRPYYAYEHGECGKNGGKNGHRENQDKPQGETIRGGKDDPHEKKRKEMLVEIMALQFTAIEFNLYLDTHPNDKGALRVYNQTVNELNQLKKTYQERYGPLTNFGTVTSEYPWHWVEEPWPWEINFAERGN